MSRLQEQLDAAFAEAYGHFAADRLAEAEAIGSEIAALQPKLAESFHLMSAIAIRHRRFDEAIELAGRAILLDPWIATYHNTVGEAHRLKGDAPGALAGYAQALAIDAGFVRAHGNIEALFAIGGGALAIDHYRRQLAATPDDPAATARLAGAFARAGHEAAAIPLYRDLIARQCANPAIHANLGLMLADLGQLDEAIDCYRAGIALEPDYRDAHNLLGLALLLKGEYAAAWPHHEYRPQSWTNRFGAPPWRGEPLEGRRILLHAEQGYGDAIQFVRYAPLVAARGGRVVLEVRPELLRLFASVVGIEAVATADRLPPDIAWHCPLMSLPLAFGTTLDSIPCAFPYLAPPAELLAAWRDAIRGAPGLKIGLAWQGQPQHRRDRDRSLPPALLAPLAQVPGISWFGLQKGPAGSLHPDLPTALRDRTTDLAPHLGDYADTAAVIAALDLVITVDTSIAHLAGALGKPAWVMLHRVPDWRWGLTGDRAPWYPHVRLFRQPQAAGWEPVIGAVARALAEIAP